MDVLVDAGSGIRLHPADLPLVLQERLEVLADRRDASASDAGLAGLVADAPPPAPHRSPTSSPRRDSA